MSGHSKWSQIKHKKAITDARRSKLFSKLSRMITTEARAANGDVHHPAVRAVIEKAKAQNMSNETIDRALKKASEKEGVIYDSILYETYAPGGVGILILTLTDNRNRTAQEIKHILTTHSCVLASVGSVVWNFKKEGNMFTPVITVPILDTDAEAVSALIEDLMECDDVQEVITNGI